MAVLERDPVAVAALRAELSGRRDAAAARLAFEFAARLQTELEALDWITAEQKVTQRERADFDVHGWADGVLVRFEVRAGRLSGWRLRACGPAAARRYLAEPQPARLGGFRPPQCRTGGSLALTVAPNWRLASGWPLGEAEPVPRVIAEERLGPVRTLGGLLHEFDPLRGHRGVVALAVGGPHHAG